MEMKSIEHACVDLGLCLQNNVLSRFFQLCMWIIQVNVSDTSCCLVWWTQRAGGWQEARGNNQERLISNEQKQKAGRAERTRRQIMRPRSTIPYRIYTHKHEDTDKHRIKPTTLQYHWLMRWMKQSDVLGSHQLTVGHLYCSFSRDQITSVPAGFVCFP